MKKLTSKQKKDIKYFLIMMVVVTIIIEFLRYVNHLNIFSFIAGQMCISILNTIRAKIYRGSDKE